ncbi:hypothetical protein COV18_01315 [Candidatus Woesearchaeota archaeon CG10_big_fil_rev_8_21_14_0_10_37_12]|nr:MAG: hypothetical protein COV18_01315 [Candidatus Woesearchaeota archaeon CG10_big_fil_rev_8_21_14_0_10_37_12]
MAKNGVTVREATPEDAEAVATVFRATYGDRYPFPQFYDPAAQREMIAAHGIESYVAANADGTIIGHGALILHEYKPAEFGRTAVHPDARGLGVFHKLINHRQAAGVDEGHRYFTTEAVTGSIGSQTGLGSNGFVGVGVEVAKYADLFDVGTGKPYKESTVVMVWDPHRTLARSESRAVYAGSARNLVDHTREKLHVARYHGTPYGLPEEGDFSLTFGEVDYVSNKVALQLQGVPNRSELATSLRKINERLQDTGINYIELDLNAEDPVTPAIMREFEENGFFPAAFIPGYLGERENRKDVIRMTRCTGPTDERKIQRTPENQIVLDIVMAHTNCPLEYRMR